jgi:hypothetical protein
LAAAKKAGATDGEVNEALYLAMRGAARATWSFIKHTISDADTENTKRKELYEGALAGTRR